MRVASFDDDTQQVGFAIHFDQRLQNLPLVFRIGYLIWFRKHRSYQKFWNSPPFHLIAGMRREPVLHLAVLFLQRLPDLLWRQRQL